MLMGQRRSQRAFITLISGICRPDLIKRPTRPGGRGGGAKHRARRANGGGLLWSVGCLCLNVTCKSLVKGPAGLTCRRLDDWSRITLNPLKEVKSVVLCGVATTVKL